MGSTLSNSHVHQVEDTPGSIVARLDPRTRLLAALGFVAGLIALKSLSALVAALAVSFILVRLARLPLHAMSHRLMHVEGFMLMLFLFLPFSVPGHERLTLGPFVATDEGLLRAAGLVIRINAAVLAIFALLGSLEPVRLGQAMARLGLPHALVHLFLFAVRYVGVFRSEARRLFESMRARAFVPRSSWHTWRTFGNFAGMMLVRSLERADRVHEAMRCRAYAGRLPLTYSDAFSWTDAAFVAALIFVVLGLVAVDRFP
jgi:cobalt/nickel transport system permease protein